MSFGEEKHISMRNQENNSNKDDTNLCSSKEASDFEAITKLIINHAQENFDSGKGITESLRTMNGLKSDELRPIMSVSASDNEATRDRESREF